MSYRLRPRLTYANVTATLELANEVIRRLIYRLLIVRQMTSIDVQPTAAHPISRIAPHARLVLWKVGDVSAILLVAGVAKQRDADNLGLDRGRVCRGGGRDGQAGDGSRDESSSAAAPKTVQGGQVPHGTIQLVRDLTRSCQPSGAPGTLSR